MFNNYWYWQKSQEKCVVFFFYGQHPGTVGYCLCGASHVLLVSTWISSGFFGFLPTPKNMPEGKQKLLDLGSLCINSALDNLQLLPAIARTMWSSKPASLTGRVWQHCQDHKQRQGKWGGLWTRLKVTPTSYLCLAFSSPMSRLWWTSRANYIFR